MMKLKGYFLCEVDEGEGIIVIAESPTEAKTLGFRHECLGDCEWIDLRARLSKEGNIKGLPKGVLDFEDGLKRNLYSYINDSDCPLCGAVLTTIYCEDGEIGCHKCLYEKEI